MHGEVEVDVVVVKRVGSRREDGGKDVAGAGLRLAQEGLFLFVAARPGLDHDDGVAIRELEPANVDRVAEGVLGQFRATKVVD
jgi:hypothetical protein